LEANVRKLTTTLDPTLFEPLNVQGPAQIEAVFHQSAPQWGSLDVIVHCLAIAWRGDLIGDYTAIIPEGYYQVPQSGTPAHSDC
jgi:enoyl-[acyl-carrier protein] reductase I